MWLFSSPFNSNGVSILPVKLYADLYNYFKSVELKKSGLENTCDPITYSSAFHSS